MTARGGVAFGPRSRLGRAARRRGRPDGRGRALGFGRAHAMARVLAPPRLDPREVGLVHVAPLVVGGGGEGSGLLHRELQHPHPRHVTLRPTPRQAEEDGRVLTNKLRETRRSDAAAPRSFLPFVDCVPSKSAPPPPRGQPPGTGAASPAPRRDPSLRWVASERASNAAARGPAESRSSASANQQAWGRRGGGGFGRCQLSTASRVGGREENATSMLGEPELGEERR